MSIGDNICRIWFKILKNINEIPWYLENNYKDILKDLYTITKLIIETLYDKFFLEPSNELLTLEDKVYKIKNTGYLNLAETSILISIIKSKDNDISDFFLVDSSNAGILLKSILKNCEQKYNTVCKENLEFKECREYFQQNRVSILKKLDTHILRILSNELLKDINAYENNYKSDKEAINYVIDLKEAFKNLSLNSSAEYVTIGKYYGFKGGKFEYNYDKAVKWYYIATELEDKFGYLYLSRCFYWGLGVQRNLNLSFKFCEKAAKLGVVVAQNDLGSHYFSGNGVKADAVKGIYWYKKAAEAGSKVAIENLSIAYNEGIGVEVDYEESLRWLEKLNSQK
ncbi:Sel1 repeat-containing protein [Clostridium collagenovorans DSM 3089]|uniref:Sel1 repeat-containing protein n=1 Tax=Clostridium collagenovorans DSM 3089 TaxID=1121306 RepID=A0A1M5SL91_9CLOT|nr:tetratricopeptide repeat protein [Clostridium collagenovorans]SHH39306.1 Sel1 repeat-containing protein [Clostridium collagenovorans DSM 3089]